MAKSKVKTAYVCQECGAEHAKWQGQCHTCGAWNSLSQVNISPIAGATGAHNALGFAGATAEIKKLAEVEALQTPRIGSGFAELDRVLGGGFVPGSVVLIGGDPGAGKSTLLLQACTKLATKQGVLYVTGEESLQQLALRAQRLKLPMDGLSVAAETRAEVIAGHIAEQRPQVVVLDSVQVLQMDGIDSTPGSVTQVRETAAFFTRLAKQQDVVIILVGHITKEGGLAGPKVLEHMIDCFMMLDSPAGSRYRTLRGHKNRFGAVNELGVFAMTDLGMKEVANPSAIFLQRGEVDSPGSIATVTWEGTRPLLVELQALVDDVAGGHPKRVAVGLDQQRLAMHLAVLHRHCGITLGDQDVFANAVGGVRINETGADLAVLLAVLGSFRDRVLPRELIVFGELGLTGELRPVANGQERLREASKHGFKHAIVPFANRPKERIGNMTIHGVKTLAAALEVVSTL
ncbi:MAG: DNA repair protein RadA [Gammaproteobacteria bacterium]|nr:DNA repair protein RadA [Gammaproteobacteria bacterium]|tara:strand:+ start:4015 stop:5394 length:1380 start_codon:yes stop_codon:yes gene_type:complete